MASSSTSSAWLICTACGTQFPTSDPSALKTCFICDDPRQFTPPSGQRFLSLDAIRAAGHRNKQIVIPGQIQKQKQQEPESKEDDADAGKIHFSSIVTEPKLAIGQRAVLIRNCTPSGGNVLWDCITVLDDDTVALIKSQGGLEAIVISHPHYYTTHLEWARAFDCPVYMAAEDAGWLVQRDDKYQRFLPEGQTEFDVLGLKVLKLGGHFPGSLVAIAPGGRLLVADTLVTTPAGLGSWDFDAWGNPRITAAESEKAEGGGGGQFPRPDETMFPATEKGMGWDLDGMGMGENAMRFRPEGMNSYSFMWSIPNMIPLPPDELLRMWRVLGRHAWRSSHGAFVGQDIFGFSEAEMRKRVLESMKIQARNSGHGRHPLLEEK